MPMKKEPCFELKNISRRQFVGSAATLAAGGLALAGSNLAAATGSGDNASRKTPGADYDVIVIGGGFGGVAAARDSMKNGLRTLLLEASNRLGGRTFSSEFEGVKVELGGVWVHNTQPFVWAEIERYDLELDETPGAVPDVMYITLEDGKRITLTLEQMTEVAAGWEIYTAAAREVVPRPYDILYNSEAALKAEKMSASERLDSLDLTPLQRAFNLGMIETIASNNAKELSYLEVLRLHLLGGGCFPTFMDAVAKMKLKDGTISLVNKMIEDGGPELRMSATVKAVHDLGEKVVVETSRGETLTCGAVISCVPMNTISRIDFKPSLPSGVSEAAKERHPGVGIKLYIKVKGDIGNVSSVAPGQALNFLMTHKQAKNYTILVALGSDPEALDIYDDEAVEKALNNHLPGARVLSTMLYDWNNDPNASGTWAMYRPGWIEKYYDQFQKEYGRIFFGSGDHGEGWRGTIDGAIGGGVRAAQKVKKLLS